MLQVVPVDGEDLVAAPQLAAHIRRTAGQDERDEDALAILAADNVEAESGRSFRQHYGARGPAMTPHRRSNIFFLDQRHQNE